MSGHPATRYGQTLCAHTEFECDCDCQCGRYVEDHDADCLWPDCACGCLPECKGCALVQEEAARVAG